MFRFFSTKRSLVRQLNVAEKTISDLKAMMIRQEEEIKTQVELKVKSALMFKDLKAENVQLKKDMQWHIDQKTECADELNETRKHRNERAAQVVDLKDQLKKAQEESAFHAEHKGKVAKEKDKWHKKFDIETLEVSRLRRKLELTQKELEEVSNYNVSLGQESFERQNTINNLRTSIKTRDSQNEQLQRQIPDPGVAKSRSGKNFTPYVAFPADMYDDNSEEQIFYSTKRFKTEDEAWVFVNNMYIDPKERVYGDDIETVQAGLQANAEAYQQEIDDAFEAIGGDGSEPDSV